MSGPRKPIQSAAAGKATTARIRNVSEGIEVEIPPLALKGFLDIPAGKAGGVVVFAHGSGSSRLSPRNNMVAAALRCSGLATLLFDLLHESEAAERANVFDISLLASRLISATLWVSTQPSTRRLPLGFFGASTGAAAALVAAANVSDVRAVVSRGGRPDLAGPALPKVRAPTLLIVGGEDTAVLTLNRAALAAMRCERRLEIVPGATHLFEEPGTLDAVVDLARDWFLRCLVTYAGM